MNIGEEQVSSIPSDCCSNQQVFLANFVLTVRIFSSRSTFKCSQPEVTTAAAVTTEFSSVQNSEVYSPQYDYCGIVLDTQKTLSFYRLCTFHCLLQSIDRS